MARSKKVTYTRSTIKQLVNIKEPRKPRDRAYVFSNGRVFHEKRK